MHQASLRGIAAGLRCSPHAWGGTERPPDPTGPIGAAVVAGQQSGAIPTNPIGGPVDAPRNEEVNQSPGSMSKSYLHENADTDEKTSALTEVARVPATVPPGTDIPPQSTLGQAIVGATRRAIDAGATDDELAAARAGQPGKQQAKKAAGSN